MMLMQILRHTPAWVWLLGAALLAYGLLQLRPRRVRPARLLGLPLALMALGLWSMAPGFAALPVTAAVWLAALAAGAAAGLRVTPPAGSAWDTTARQLLLPGSVLPLLLIVSIFVLRYAVGVGSALHPEWRSLLPLQAALAVVFGLLSGFFVGRSLGLLRLARAPRAATPGIA